MDILGSGSPTAARALVQVPSEHCGSFSDTKYLHWQQNSWSQSALCSSQYVGAHVHSCHSKQGWVIPRLLQEKQDLVCSINICMSMPKSQEKLSGESAWQMGMLNSFGTGRTEELLCSSNTKRPWQAEGFSLPPQAGCITNHGGHVRRHY